MLIGSKWGFWHTAHCMAEHSRNDIEIKLINEIPFHAAKKFDVIFPVSMDCWGALESRWGHAAANSLIKKRKVICGLTSKNMVNRKLKEAKSKNFHCIRVPSITTREYILKKTDVLNIKVVQHGVNPDFFKPTSHPNRPFTIGWAGNYWRKEKRTYLLSRLQHPLKTARDIPYVEMPQFYGTVDAYVCLSTAEGSPMPVLEAMSCGLPVVSTPVGLVPELLSEAWRVPLNPDEEIVQQTREKLDRLCHDVDLREEAGERNRAEILRNWTCKIRAKAWDALFEG